MYRATYSADTRQPLTARPLATVPSDFRLSTSVREVRL